MTEEDEKGYKVTDKRGFTPEGEKRAEAGPGPEAAGAAAVPINFTTFIVSLGSSALFHLGDVPHPETGKAEKDLTLAKQTIDILGVLQQKTRGNLDQDEADLLENLLFDLRLRFVEASKG